MNYKSLLPSFCLVLALSDFSWAQSAGTSFSEAQKTKKAKLICLYSETPGYIEPAAEGAKGMLPAIMTSFAAYVRKNQGIDVTCVYESFKINTPIPEIFNIVNSSGDGVFGLVFVFITDERRKQVMFSDPIFQSPSFLITSNTVPEIKSVGEASQKLKGFTAYVNQGNFYEVKFRALKNSSLPDLKIEYFKSYHVANIAETVAKPNAMMYVDVSGFLYALEKKLPFKSHKVLQFTTPMGVTLSKANTWKDEFNKFLQSGYLKSGEFKKVVADNLGHLTLDLLKI
ncbi:MAG: substrate-binding periplasmic protein [Bacteroidota bacterium]